MRPAYRMISPKDGRSHREFSVDLALLSIRECILVGFVRGPDQKKGKLKKPQERKKGGFISKQNSWDWIARGFRLAHKHISRRLFSPGAGPCVGSKKKEPHPHIVQFRQQVVGHLAVVSFILLSQIFCFHLVCFAFCFRKQNGEKLTFVCWL